MDFVILGLENQQKIHYAMPLRIMQGDVMLYMKEYNEIQKEHKKNPDETSGEFLSKFKKTDRLHPVITICVYYGEEEWDGPKCLTDMLKISDKMEALVSDYKMNFLEIKKSESMNFKPPVTTLSQPEQSGRLSEGRKVIGIVIEHRKTLIQQADAVDIAEGYR